MIIPVALAALHPQSLKLTTRTLRRVHTHQQANAAGHWTPDDTGRDPQPMPTDHSDELRALSDEQLCRLWQSSYLEIVDAVSPVQLLYLSDLRRAVLDTLAARDPAGFAKWLNAGARAASDPRRYIQGPQNRRRIQGN